MFLLDEEDRYRINVFDWKKAFPEALMDGGFHAVIGNPPYGALLSDPERDYLSATYQTATSELDTYALFMDKAVTLTKVGRPVSMIVPTGWYSGVRFSSLRRFIAENTDPRAFINLPYDIFSAWVDTTVFVLTKRSVVTPWPRKGRHVIHVRTFPKRYRVKTASDIEQDQTEVDFCGWFSTGTDEYLTYASTLATALITKIQTLGRPLSDLADVQRGDPISSYGRAAA